MKSGIAIQRKRKVQQPKLLLWIKENFSLQSLFWVAAVFFISRVTFFGDLKPFGAAAYIAHYKSKIDKKILFVIVLVGVLSAGDLNSVFILLVTLFLFNAVFLRISEEKKTYLLTSVAGTVSFFIAGLFVNFIKGFVIYELMTNIFNSGCVFFSTYIISRYLYDLGNIENNIYESEDLDKLDIGFIFIAALTVAGTSKFEIAFLNLGHVLAGIFILITGWRIGAGYAAALGAMAGMFSALDGQGDIAVLSGIYAVSGAVTGSLKKTKWSCAFGYILTQLIIGALSTGAVQYEVNIIETICAPVIFMLIPISLIEKATDKQTKLNMQRVPEKSYYMRVQEITSKKLSLWAQAFMNLSKTVLRFEQKSKNIDTSATVLILERTAGRVCNMCSLSEYCWGTQFYNTYKLLSKAIANLEKKGRITQEELHSYLQSQCIKTDKLAEQLNFTYEIYKIEKIWRKAVEENKEIFPQQIQGISRLLSELSREIALQYVFFHKIEDNIKKELTKHNINPDEIMVYKSKDGYFIVEVIYKGCGGLRECSGKMEDIISKTIGREMNRKGRGCQMNRANSCCNIQFKEKKAFSVTTGVAKMCNQNSKISGDSYTFLESDDGLYVLALSDGMGHGKEAEKHSSAAIQMIEELFEAGFDREMIVYLINTLLRLETETDKFATLDIAFINLHSGMADFIKNGAVPTFIKRNERVDVVHSVSLPAGILKSIEIEVNTINLRDGDFIITMSDGVYDVIRNRLGEKRKIIEWIRSIKTRNPQEIADIILEKAKQESETEQDDKTVLVSKIWMKS